MSFNAEHGKKGLIRPMQWAALVIVAMLAAACAVHPTPYQPLRKNGGFEETRLQEQVYRVSFKANRYTSETDVIDFLFFRSAELTLQSGYTHFIVQEDFGRTRMELRPVPGSTSLHLGFGVSRRRSFWGLGFGHGFGYNYAPEVSYHLGMFVIRMLTGREAEDHREQAYHAKFIINSLTPKKEKSLRKGS